MEWSRKAELSADRAGLLATQDPQVAFRVHMKLASGGHLDDLDTTSFFAQGAEYDESRRPSRVVAQLLLVETQAHPFAVVRATELRRWVDTGDYTAILAGGYPRRDEDADRKVSDAAAKRPRATPSRSATGDALGKFLHDVAGVLGSVKGWWDGLTRRDDDSEPGGPARASGPTSRGPASRFSSRRASRLSGCATYSPRITPEPPARSRSPPR